MDQYVRYTRFQNIIYYFSIASMYAGISCIAGNVLKVAHDTFSEQERIKN